VVGRAGCGGEDAGAAAAESSLPAEDPGEEISTGAAAVRCPPLAGSVETGGVAPAGGRTSGRAAPGGVLSRGVAAGIEAANGDRPPRGDAGAAPASWEAGA
jgi:hypothetical protein